jgi:flagellar biosynthesis activator protein FlaF
MQTAAQAHAVVAGPIADPRAMEADLLLRAARRLEAVHDGWENRRTELDSALRYNRQLWAIFLTSVTSGEQPLPVDIRQSVANLGLFVMNQTLAMLQEPRRAPLGALININRELAAGLLGR